MENKRNTDAIGISTRNCAICGKSFVISPLYMYKIPKNKFNKCYKYYCSYTCYRKGGGDNGKFTTHYAKRK